MTTQHDTEPENGRQSTMEVSVEAWAAQVRDVLEGTGPMPLANVARRISNATTNEVAMAVGWLARAGEVGFSSREGLSVIHLQGTLDEPDGEAVKET